MNPNPRILEITNACKTVLLSEQKYLTKSKIASLIGVPRTTILSMGLDTDAICEELGFVRTTLKPKGDGATKLIFLEKFRSGYIEYLKKVKYSASLHKYLDSLGLSAIEKSKYYRYDLEVERCHELADVRYVKNHGLDYIGAQIVLRDLILTKQRYVTEIELAQMLGVSRTLLTINRTTLRLSEINKEYGFTRNLRSFESRVGEWLSERFPLEILEREKYFSDLQSPVSKRGILRFDYCLPGLNLLVEVDGPAHWDTNYMYYSDKVVSKDAAKTEYCMKKGITLLRINYTEKYSKSDFEIALSGIPLKPSVGRSAAEPAREGSETIRKE